MEAKEEEQKNVLNVKKVNLNSWNKEDYENLKRAKGMGHSLRGSQIVKDVISNLQIRGFYNGDGDYNFNDEHEYNYNKVFQRFYGQSFREFLEKNKPNMRQLIDMRRADRHDELLEVRARMIDWMIEVFTVYHTRGSNEYTYFKAVTFLDMLLGTGQINAENIHLYGIAVMYLASNLLDKRCIEIDDAFNDIAHKQFSKNKILRYVNRAIEGLEFNFRTPTWVEYLDKIIFDTFGDYRENLAEFNIRQTAIFVLHACAFDVMFYSWDPFRLAVVALMYSINSFFTNFEKSCAGGNSQFDLMRAKTSKENIVNHILTHSKLTRALVRQNLMEFSNYLDELMSRVQNKTYLQLSKLFNYEITATS